MNDVEIRELYGSPITKETVRELNIIEVNFGVENEQEGWFVQTSCGNDHIDQPCGCLGIGEGLTPNAAKALAEQVGQTLDLPVSAWSKSKTPSFNGFNFERGIVKGRNRMIEELTRVLEQKDVTAAQWAELLVDIMDGTSEIACEIHENDEFSAGNIETLVKNIQSYVEDLID